MSYYIWYIISLILIKLASSSESYLDFKSLSIEDIIINKARGGEPVAALTVYTENCIDDTECRQNIKVLHDACRVDILAVGCVPLELAEDANNELNGNFTSCEEDSMDNYSAHLDGLVSEAYLTENLLIEIQNQPHLRQFNLKGIIIESSSLITEVSEDNPILVLDLESKNQAQPQTDQCTLTASKRKLRPGHPDTSVGIRKAIFICFKFSGESWNNGKSDQDCLDHVNSAVTASLRNMEIQSFNRVKFDIVVPNCVYNGGSLGSTAATHGVISSRAKNAVLTDSRPECKLDSLTEYKHFGIFFPSRSFNWAGLASLSGKTNWYNGLQGSKVIEHEIGHNIGLSHANVRDKEYGSSYDMMDQQSQDMAPYIDGLK